MKKRTKKRLIVITLLSVILLAYSIAISYAWFINNREVGIHSGENMSITVGNRLEIGILGDDANGDEWGSSVEVKTGEKTCPDISGDGINFYFPTTLTTEDEPTYSIPKNFKHINTLENANDYYIHIKLKFRTNTPMKVYLSNVSAIVGENMDKNDDLSKKVPSGAIAGAMRVGIYEEIATLSDEGETLYSEDLKCVWIPNDKYELGSVPSNNEYGYDLTFNQSGSRESGYYYLAPDNGVFNSATQSMEIAGWSLDDYASGKVLVGNDRLASNDDHTLHTNGSTAVLNFDCQPGEVMEKTLVIRIWIEGTDREAHTNLNGGKISYNLDFVGIFKDDFSEDETAVLEEVKADGAGLYTLNENNERVAYDNTVPLDYSFNGIDWYSYDPSADLADLFSGKQKVCVRLSETDDNVSTDYRVLTVRSA